MVQVPELREAVVAAGKRKAEELEIPFEVPTWIHRVPEDKQEDALVRFHVHARAKIERDMEAMVKRDARKVERKAVVEAIKNAGYDLCYCEMFGFVIAIAYNKVGTDEYGVKFKGHFSICAKDDRAFFSRVKARKNLLDRIESGDEKFSFSGVVPETLKHEQLFILHRLYERATFNPAGLPHLLVSILQGTARSIDRHGIGNVR